MVNASFEHHSVVVQSLLNQLEYASNCVYNAYETLNETGDVDCDKLDKACRMAQELLDLIDSAYNQIDTGLIEV